MNEIEYLLAAILVMAISTYLTRLTPFLMFTPGKENAKLNFVAKNTPPMVMMILVIYMLKEVDYLSTEIFYTLFALAVTVGLQILKRNALLSIVSGTIVYMFFVQM
ncbi:AzlD domain-containing protein [Candidatus Thioglobus sp.]|jgi:branched-subunit amino acid transport protein AzlD|nr:AzlD domain-containing protein [Candidatus Pseudothioglobus singularis]MDA9642356.1 AzlD domain-containing protein [Candidatus Thioglobus sp.]MDA7441457.1 AzlD domain-containing protein [Candidatus Pseudothioglobus singularis]MDB4598302.1 AzlD domain-containing protein [Candidatus Pseudothioglobus singularis]MDC0470224.1 AzlD domain-containing protein [Candidatus Pseudothioglobus singularis]MDC0499130.1 AzlD domain-containing protein [Candidatus Pseudothioglobus singularis]|tara:strand:+ start:596 stop:913 length:318 start_codon:yes stop_codon:yes gene_type:complete